MRELPLPEFTAEQTFEDSYRPTRNPSKRSLYQAATGTVVACAEAYDQAAKRGELGDAEPDDYAVEGLRRSKGEKPEPVAGAGMMTDLYEKRFRVAPQTKRIVDALLSSSPNGRCPYCGRDTVKTLDHFLPKSRYPAVAVHPANLVPACWECNREKEDAGPSAGVPFPPHPYFDSDPQVRWLQAQVVPSSSGPPTIEFSVKSGTGDSVLEGRMRRHFEMFSLAKRFGTWAAQHLADFERLVHLDGMGVTTKDEARKQLTLDAERHSSGHLNSVERATYEAMRDSDWYLAEYLGLK